MGAERPVACGDAVLGAERGGDHRRRRVVEREGHDADPIRLRAEHREHLHAIDVGEPGEEVLGEGGVVGGDGVPADLGQGPAGGGEGDGPDQVRGAALVTRRAGGPLHVVQRDAAHRPAAGEVRRGGVQPVTAPDEHAGAVRRVELVAGEGDVVRRPSAARSTPRCGASCAASTTTRAPWRWATSTIVGDRQRLAGHVAGRGHGDQRRPRLAQRAARRRRRRARPLPSPASPGGSRRRARQGRRLAWCSRSSVNTAVPAGRAAASRFSESVVLRVNTTASPSRAPAKRPTRRRARSRASLQTVEVYPAPRCTRAVPRQQLGHHVSDGRQGRRAGGVVEVHRSCRAAGHERHERVGPDDVEQRRGRGVGRGAEGDEGHAMLRVRGATSATAARACRRRAPSARSSPGAPHRDGGLPASEPGLGAGAHDLPAL